MRYLSTRKENQHKSLILQIKDLLQSNMPDVLFISGIPNSLYEDLWNIRTKHFKHASNRLRFKKQYNGVLIEISPQILEQMSMDLWDGISYSQLHTRQEIAFKVMESPCKVRFYSDLSMTQEDIDKLKKLATSLHLTVKQEEDYICFYPLDNPEKSDD